MALFIGCYLFIVGSSNKRGKRRANTIAAQKAREWAEFYRSYGADQKMFEEFETNARLEAHWCSDPLPNNLIVYRKMRNEIQRKTKINPTPSMVACGILAQQGLVTGNMALFGIRLYHANKAYVLPFLKWYDKELQEHGIGYRMLYYEQCKPTCECTPVDELTTDMVIGGVCAWIPGCSVQCYDRKSTLFIEGGL